MVLSFWFLPCGACLATFVKNAFVNLHCLFTTIFFSCSICNMKSNLHFVVPADKFYLLKGTDNIQTYTFNTHQAKHMFCKTCGVQSFYIPRSNPDGYGEEEFCIDVD